MIFRKRKALLAYEKKYPKGENARTCVREGFKSNGDVVCKGCFEKKLENDALKEKIKSLQAALRHKERSVRDKPFGANTPSSKELKKNTDEENRKKTGGAKPGHKGHGRKSHHPDDKATQHKLDPVKSCPNCDVALREIDTRTRSIIDVHPMAAFKKLFSFGRFECPCCGDRFKTSVPALPKFRFSNRLLAQVAIVHFLHGVPLKKVSRMLGDDVSERAIHNAFDKLSNLCMPAKTLLIEDYRASKVRHADETGWRTDGRSGYAWFFGSENTSIFEFRDSRSGAIAREVLGTKSLPGFLVVDRYAGYNKTQCKIQYCLAHLLRDVKSLATEFPDDAEISRFVRIFGKLLAQAMKLKNLKISNSSYYRQAAIPPSLLDASQSQTLRKSAPCCHP